MVLLGLHRALMEVPDADSAVVEMLLDGRTINGGADGGIDPIGIRVGCESVEPTFSTCCCRSPMNRES